LRSFSKKFFSAKNQKFFQKSENIFFVFSKTDTPVCYNEEKEFREGKV